MISEQMKLLANIAERLETDPELDMDIGNLQDLWAKDIRDAINTIETLSKKVRANNLHGEWISCSDRLPRPKGDSYWARCIVSVMRSHCPTSTYDICDAPYDEEYVMYANYDAVQKIWHLDSDEQVNALISIEDAPLNGDCVIAWMPLPEPYKEDN